MCKYTIKQTAMKSNIIIDRNLLRDCLGPGSWP